MTIIAIEGPDGCGKTTQAKLLVQRLKREGHNAIYVRPVFVLSDMLSTITRSNIVGISPSPRRMRLDQLRLSKKHMKIFLSIGKWLMAVLGYAYGILSYMVIAYYSARKRVVICDRYFYQFLFDLFGGFTERIIRIFPRPEPVISNRLAAPPEMYASAAAPSA